MFGPPLSDLREHWINGRRPDPSLGVANVHGPSGASWHRGSLAAPLCCGWLRLRPLKHTSIPSAALGAEALSRAKVPRLFTPGLGARQLPVTKYSGNNISMDVSRRPSRPQDIPPSATENSGQHGELRSTRRTQVNTESSGPHRELRSTRRAQVHTENSGQHGELRSTRRTQVNTESSGPHGELRSTRRAQVHTENSGQHGELRSIRRTQVITENSGQHGELGSSWRTQVNTENSDGSQTGARLESLHLVDVTWWMSVSPGNPDSRSPGLQDLGGFGRVEGLGVRLPAEGFYLPASLSKRTPDPHLNRSKMAALNTEDRTHSLIFVQKADGNRLKLDQDTLEWRWSVEPNPAAINY
ncbi:unnamed protein product [Boreogadus saida]